MLKNIKVGTRLFFMVTFSLVVTIVIALLGVRSMSIMHDEMNSLYTESTEPLVELGDINGQLIALNLEVFRALQHDPQIEISKYHDNHELKVHEDRVNARLEAIDTLWAGYLKTPLTDAEKVLIKEFEANFVPYRRDYLLPTLAAVKKGDFSYPMISHFLDGNRTAGLAMETTVVALLDLQGAIAKAKIEMSNSAYESAKIMMMVVFGIGFLLSIFIGYVIVDRIVKQLAGLQKTITQVEETGDFTQRIEVSGHDELGQTAASFNKLLGALQGSISGILKQASALDQSSVSLLLASKESAQSSEISSESSVSMAASIEEMMVGISSISENAKGTAEVTKNASELSRAGTKIIHDTVEEMHAMSEAVHESALIIDELGQQSEQISSIVQVIKDVADQTNLLALNAAIEAARAGEQGRGFAVVADEVRKLAERTTGATVEIGSMIDGLQKSSGSAVSAMKLAEKRVRQGVSLAEQAGKAITEIQTNGESIQTHVNDITASLAEQAVAGQTIAVQVERVAQAAEQNIVTARNSSELAGSIEQLGKELHDEVVKFKVA